MIINVNGSFEQGFLYWPIRENPSGGSAFWELSSTDARSGSRCAVRRGGSGVGSAMRTEPIACRPGDSIVASCYIKRTGSSSNGRIRISFWDENYTELFIVNGDSVTSSTYVRAAVRATVPDGMYLFRIDLVSGNLAGTDVFFDDVELDVISFDLPDTVDYSVPAISDPWTTGRSRVATQYTQSTRFLGYLEALLKPISDIQAANLLNLIQTDVEEARGYNLDVLGEIVGVGRVVPEAIALTFFGFDDQIVSAPFGEEGLLYAGARFREETEDAFSSSVLADPEYRLLIKSRIIRNHTRATNEDILRALLFLFNIDVIIIDDNGGMEIGLTFGRQLTVAEIAMINNLDVLPRPAAVKIRRRAMFLPGKYFGFEGQPGALPFGEEGSSVIGGPLAEEF